MMKSLQAIVTACVVLLAASAAPGQTPSPSGTGSSGVAEVLRPFVDNRTLAGAVTLVASPERILDLEAVGWADVAARTPMRTDAVFWIASQSKPITAAALMILVDEGKVKVDDPVEAYLPEFKDLWVPAEADREHMLLKHPRHPILVREVLSHTSGLPFSSPIEKPTLDLYPLELRVRSYAMLPLLFEPGSRSQYSNAGINTAGRIIEVVGGMPYEQFLDERLFRPLGMSDTTFWPSGTQLERVPRAYRPAKDGGLEEVPINQLKYPLDSRQRQPMPAGGLFSTAEDISKFYRMLAGGGVFEGRRILSEDAVRQMTSDQSGEAHSNYGFGTATNAKTFGHGGAYGTNSTFDREQKLILVFLVQHAGWGQDGKTILPLFQKTARKLFGGKPVAAGEAPAGEATAATPPGWPAILDRVRFLPAEDRADAMIGGRIAGSNVSAREGFETLAEIQDAPRPGEWNEIGVYSRKPYRWVRYEAPTGSHGNLAEIEFYAGPRRLRGAGFGSPGQRPPGGNWRMALDGKAETFFNSNRADGQFLGYDLGEVVSAARPAIDPGEGSYDRPQLVTLTSRTPGTTFRYTLDGTTPDADHGQQYTAPFTLEEDGTITAVSFKEGLPPSPATTATLWIGKARRPTLRTFHVGNSLTNNASRFTTFFRTAGGTDAFPKFLIGGATTERLWNAKDSTDRARWEDAWKAAQHPLDHFTMQPRDFDVAREADHCTRFIRLVREQSPDVQPWLYAEWVEMARQRPTDKGLVPSSQMTRTFPALTWQESMGAMLLYVEEVERQIVARHPGGKPPRIIPTAPAMGWARSLIDRGEMPGVAAGEESYYSMLFEDQVHVNPSGCYLVDLTWYAALLRESPEGKMLPVGTALTAAQAHTLERLAWDVVKNYPDCGLYEEGSTPCGKPEIVRDGETLTLKSSTPGAWFRYTLDGTTPTRTNGYIYCGVISNQPGIRLKAVAYKSGMADSDVADAGPS
jgi:CubicO group peptidase (beta-lactamase class C family)